MDGPTDSLKSFILHDDRKPLSRWLSEQDRYMRREAEKLPSASPATLNRADRIR